MMQSRVEDHLHRMSRHRERAGKNTAVILSPENRPGAQRVRGSLPKEGLC